jgi:hypothetical protein
MGSIIQPLLYLIGENGAFASQLLLDMRARITHLWYVQPGMRPSPWIGRLLRRLRTECVVRDSGFFAGPEMDYQKAEYLSAFPNLEGEEADDPVRGGWRPVGDAPEGGLRWYQREGGRNERHRATLQWLFELDPCCQWLAANAGLEKLTLQSDAFFAVLGRRASVNLYDRRRHVAEAAATAFAEAAEYTWFQELLGGEFAECFRWDQKSAGECCVFKNWRSKDLLALFQWEKDGVIYVWFPRNRTEQFEFTDWTG